MSTAHAPRGTGGSDPHRCVRHHQPWLGTTAVCVGVDRGSRTDPDGRAGIAHLFEHLVMSARGGGASLTDVIEQRGGQSNASSGNEKTLYFARVANEDAADTLRALCEAVTKPAIEPADLERERTTVLQELAAAAADPGDVVQDAFLADLFGAHPLGRPVGGAREDIEAVRHEDILAYQARSLEADGMAVAVVGGASPEAIDAVLPAYAGYFDRPARRKAAGAPAAAGPADRTGWPADEDFVWAAVGGRSVAQTDPRRHAFAVLGHLLGGSPASLLYRALRDEAGLAYTFQAWPSHYDDAGSWRVLMGVETANGPAAVGIVERLLNDLAEAGPAARDLDIARRQAVGAFVRDQEDPLERAVNEVMGALSGLDGWTAQAETAALRAVDADAVRHAAADVLASLRVTVRPTGAS